MANTNKAKAVKSRQLKTKPYKSFRLQKRVKQNHNKLPGAFKLLNTSISHLLKYNRLFLGIVAIYLVLTIVMVKGLGISSGLSDLKDVLEAAFSGSSSELLTGLTLFGVLLSSTGSASSDVAGVYQSLIIVTTSLAVIWALRQTYANKATSVRESFYKGMYPLVPFLLVLLVIGLQFIPLLIGNWLYSVALSGGIAVTAVEKFLWILLIAALTILSLYMVSSSVFALYISTLPNMTPIKALRSARQLVHFRRWTVMRKVLFLPFSMIILGAVIMVPVIIFITPLAEWLYFILSMLSLAIIHSYMYKLYRELL